MDVNDQLLRLAKQRAIEEGTSLKQVVENALRAHLSGPVQRPPYKLRWRTEKGKVLPGVDLNDRVALFDRMDGRE